MSLREGRGPLFTDHYQLAMAQVHVREGLADRLAQFDYFYRSNPDYGSHQAGFCVATGLGPLLEWMQDVHVTDAEVDALSRFTTSTGVPVFEPAFLDWLAEHGHFRDLVLEAERRHQRLELLVERLGVTLKHSGYLPNFGCWVGEQPLLRYQALQLCNELVVVKQRVRYPARGRGKGRWVAAALAR